MKKSPKVYLDVKEYSDAAEALYMAAGMILFSFAKNECSTKDVILRNFVARAAVSQKSVMSLYHAQDYPNAWVIHRAMLDRMFHLHSIGENHEYEEFDDWSFFNQYKEQNRLRSDSEFNHEAVGWVYDLTRQQKERFRFLSNAKPKWKRPKPEDVAKGMGMPFLYKYGYDYASKLVHPMSDDGQQDFYTITGLEPKPKYPSQISVLSNTVLATTIIIQTAMNQSSFSWIKLLWDFIDQVRLVLDGESPDEYKLTMLKLCKAYESNDICATKDS